MQVSQEDTVTLETGADPGQALAAEFAVGSNLPLTWDEEARAGRGYENACRCISANVCGPLGARRLLSKDRLSRCRCSHGKCSHTKCSHGMYSRGKGGHSKCSHGKW